jgi:hypothetical protein
MSARTIFSAFTLIMLMTACGNTGENKPPRKLLIPEDKLVKILTDTYLTDGMLDVYAVRETWSHRDSVQNYIDIIADYGYTLEQFNATLKYYFADKPKKLSRIYDKVTGNLLELETMVMTENPPSAPEIAKNLWPGKSTYLFPEEITRDPIWFDIPAERPGQYVLTASIRIFEDDRSLNPRVTVFFSHTDSAGVEKRDYWDEVSLEKDDEFHNVILRKSIDSVAGVRVRGWLLNHDNQPGPWKKHARVANINLIVTDIPEKK